MIRNWNIIEHVLKRFEAEDVDDYLKSQRYLTELKIDEEDYCKHIELVIDAGLVRNASLDRWIDGKFEAYAFSGAYLTMEGHDLLDAMRNKKFWTRIKAKSVSSGIALSWEFIKAAIPIVIKEALK